MAKREKQLGFETLKVAGFKRPGDAFGGSLLKSHPKCKRPLDSKYATLVTLRANVGGMRRPAKFNRVTDVVYDAARKYGIKIYDFVNVGNHLHMIIKLSHPRFWAPFIREVTSKIAALFDEQISQMGLDTRGHALRFWKFRPHTRIIRSWRKAFRIAREYMSLNRAEAGGFINRSQTKTLKDYRALFSDA